MDTAISQVTATLARRHHIRTGQLNDFSVRNLSQIAEAQESSSQVMAALLAMVASISLLVGGIGIMNILLVSVTERTREIGIRMAIGARRLQVLLQFLVESVLLSVTGGVAGIGFGLLVSFIISSAGALADPGFPHRRPRRLCVLGGGRNLLRLLSGSQGRQPQSDRRASLRVDTTCGGTSRIDRLDEPLTGVPSGASPPGSSVCEVCLLIEVEVCISHEPTRIVSSVAAI